MKNSFIFFICVEEGSKFSSLSSVHFIICHAHRATITFSHSHLCTMHRLLLLLVAVSSALALPSRSSNTVVVPAHPHDSLTFDEFTAVFNKQYANDAEARRRQAIYESNKQFVADFNSKKTADVTFTVGINAFADLTAEEFAQLGARDNSKKFEPAPVCAVIV